MQTDMPLQHLAHPETHSDANITRSAENLMLWLTHWPKNAIQVSVREGWVTLTGEVNLQFQKKDAAEAVRFLMGVTGVSNKITIKHTLSFGAIRSDIEADLKRHAQENICVIVEGGDVTLTGMVHSPIERTLAEHSAWGTPGVNRVMNHITVVQQGLPVKPQTLLG